MIYSVLPSNWLDEARSVGFDCSNDNISQSVSMKDVLGVFDSSHNFLRVIETFKDVKSNFDWLQFGIGVDQVHGREKHQVP